MDDRTQLASPEAPCGTSPGTGSLANGCGPCRFCSGDFSRPQPIRLQLAVPVRESFRVAQVTGMFDLPIGDKSVRTIEVTFGPLPSQWHIGLVVGPSGSGKSSLVNWLFGPHVYRPEPWPADRAIVDAFPQVPLKLLVRTLTAVGLSSPPAWLRPYHVLSTGEKFRCDLARALLSTARTGGSCPAKEPSAAPGGSSPPGQPAPCLPLVVFDEFTSVVDRTVARAIAAALARTIRSGLLPCRFIAVTCHYDVTPWLEPDWILDAATGKFTTPHIRRPPIVLELFRSKREAWALFAPHHYLTARLSPAAECFLAFWENRPVCFCAVLPQAGRPGWRRISRLVTLPDYQGLGIGSAILQAVAQLLLQRSLRTSITTSHPAMIAFLRRSPDWRVTRRAPCRPQFRQRAALARLGRWVVSAEYWPMAPIVHTRSDRPPLCYDQPKT